ncbi:hypothetical protein KJ359_006371 [Pestalotiopsis sp. 9143b]|nr:hypothetical protein KJ359_006371 [Pestalotiopsis sp. 9143b]
MASKPVVLILGSGPRVGLSVAKKFASSGYSVAIASRSGSGSKNEQGYLSLQADLTKPDAVPALFAAVKSEFQTVPSVVVYNAAGLTVPPNKDSVLSVPTEAVVSDLNINTVTPYVAAQQAVAAWESLPKETKKTFIYTGNILNTKILPVPMMINLGVGKSASAYWVGTADTLYSPQGYRFFYADERFADGKHKGMELDGEAHGDFYAQLANHEGKVPWLATFVKDKGYVQF